MSVRQGYDVEGKKGISAAEAIRYGTKGEHIKEEYKQDLNSFYDRMGHWNLNLFSDTEREWVYNNLKKD